MLLCQLLWQKGFNRIYLQAVHSSQTQMRHPPYLGSQRYECSHSNSEILHWIYQVCHWISSQWRLFGFWSWNFIVAGTYSSFGISESCPGDSSSLSVSSIWNFKLSNLQFKLFSSVSGFGIGEVFIDCLQKDPHDRCQQGRSPGHAVSPSDLLTRVVLSCNKQPETLGRLTVCSVGPSCWKVIQIGFSWTM